MNVGKTMMSKVEYLDNSHFKARIWQIKVKKEREIERERVRERERVKSKNII